MQLRADCYPNPFSHSARIRYVLPYAGDVRITILSLDGKIVASLQNGYQPEGEHSVNWHPGNQPDGIYFYQIRFNDKIHTGKLILNR
jgi:hypothetical protein